MIGQCSLTHSLSLSLSSTPPPVSCPFLLLVAATSFLLSPLLSFSLLLSLRRTHTAIPSGASVMAALVVAVLLLAMTGHSSATWCVCKDGLSDAVLQKTLDYACGAGADCGPTHQNGGCFQPNTVKAHCSYAVNSYFQKKGQAQGSCDFSGTAQVSTSDPSYSGCTYPSSVSAAGTPATTTPTTTTSPVTTNPTTGTTGTTPSTTTPYSGTPTGVLGGAGTGLGPSGAGINQDYSDGGFRLPGYSSFIFVLTLLVSGLMLLQD